MMKNKVPQIILGAVILVALLVLGMLYSSNKSLESDLLSSRSQLESLKKEISGLKLESSKAKNSVAVKTVKKSIKKAAPVDKSAPKISADPRVVDFGTIRKADGLVLATITLKNEGEKPLLLSYAFTSCGCTAAPLEKQSLLSGESTKFDVSYDPNYLGEFYDLGQVEKKITIITNDPQNPFYTVKLKANVIP